MLYGERRGGLIALNEFVLDTAAIGGLIGSVNDFARFLHAQLAPKPAVLSAALTQMMQSKVADGAAGIESREGMALGWKVGRAHGRPFLNHEGGGAGFTTELRLYPEERVGIALAMNAMRMPRTMRAAHRICESVLNARPRGTSERKTG
jgi:CubicO group peptidase (beta-lactamase class C family)